MRVAVDAQLAAGTATGIGEYASGLIAAVRSCGADVVELSEKNLDPWRFDRRVYWDQLLLPRRARASHADLLHCTAGTMPLRLPLPAIVTVHDVAWLKVQRHARWYARYYFGTFSLRRYRDARRILVDSQFSRNELLDVLDVAPEKVEVVYPGVADDFCAIRRQRLEERMVIIPGTVERRKNVEIAIRALAHVPGAHLVSVGPFTAYRDECARLARRLGVEDRVQFRGYVPRSTLLHLYATCALVAVPSRYEGFGYAAAQALCAGAPVLAAASSSLPEVVGAAAPLIDPYDVDAWAQAFRLVLDGREAAEDRARSARASAIERFSWRSIGRTMLGAYERALADL